MKRLRVVVLGGLGRLGSQIVDAITLDPGLELKGIVDSKKGRPKKGTGKAKIYKSLQDLKSAVDIVIDVTGRDAVENHVTWAAKTKTPYVLAVTGLDGKTHDVVGKLQKKQLWWLLPT